MEKNRYLYNEFLSRLQRLFVTNILVSGLFILLFIICSTTIVGQTVIIGKYPQKVPQGKKWTLTSKMQPLIEINEGTLNSGTLCNARILSNPKSVEAILEGDYGRPNKSYEIRFNELSKVAYTNALTYKISSISLFQCSDYKENQEEKRSSDLNAITFYQGQSIYVMGCLESIQLFESTLTQKEIIELDRKDKLKKKQEIEEKERIELVNNNSREKEIRDKLNTGYEFFEYELTNIFNTPSPLLICKRKDGLKSFFFNCLLGNENNPKINITYDTNSNPIKVSKTVSDGTQNGTKTISDFNCSEKEIIDSLKIYFQLSQPAKISYKEISKTVPVVKCIWVESRSKFSITVQNVTIKKKRGNIELEMHTETGSDRYEQRSLDQNQFSDTSYTEKIKEYIINNPPNTTGRNFGINYYAIRIDETVQIEYNDNDKQTFSRTIWKVFDNRKDFIKNI